MHVIIIVLITKNIIPPRYCYRKNRRARCHGEISTRANVRPQSVLYNTCCMCDEATPTEKSRTALVMVDRYMTCSSSGSTTCCITSRHSHRMISCRGSTRRRRTISGVMDTSRAGFNHGQVSFDQRRGCSSAALSAVFIVCM